MFMERGRVYEAGATVWQQFARTPREVLYSADNGVTWSELPGMDTGKWDYSAWLFRLK